MLQNILRTLRILKRNRNRLYMGLIPRMGGAVSRHMHNLYKQELAMSSSIAMPITFDEYSYLVHLCGWSKP